MAPALRSCLPRGSRPPSVACWILVILLAAGAKELQARGLRAPLADTAAAAADAAAATTAVEAAPPPPPQLTRLPLQQAQQQLPLLPTSGTTAPELLALIPLLTTPPLAGEVLPEGAPVPPLQEVTGTPLSFTAAAAGEQDAQLPPVGGGHLVTAPAGVPPPATYAAIFDKHNAYRARHQAPPLAWDDALASQAAAYASQCVFGHDPAAFTGESLYASSDLSNAAYSLGNAIDLWYKEVGAYDFAAPGFSAATGHFTQVVWKSSTRLGCAVQVCARGIANAPFATGTLVVCRYAPPGNVIGAFPANVLPPIAPPAPPPGSPPSAQLPPATLPGGFKFVSPGCLGSVNGRFWLCMQADGNVVLFQDKTPLWASNSAGRSSFKPFKLTMQKDGQLVASDNLNQAVWASGTAVRGAGPFKLVVHDDGNAVIYNAGGDPLWGTNTGGH